MNNSKMSEVGVSSKTSTVVVWSAVALALVLVGCIIVKVWDIGFWRHDNLSYLKSHFLKLRNEGRWFNHLFFYSLKPLNGHIAWIVDFSGFALFFFRVARLYTASISSSTLLALICLMYPGFYSLILWTSGIIPSIFLLVVATYLAPLLSIWIFFSMFGVLFFGSYPPFYFFLPLLFMGKDSSFSEKPLSCLYKLLPIWVFGFILGYFFASLFNLVVIGEYGFHLATWRELTPATDFSSFMLNVCSRIACLYEHLSAMFPNHFQILLLVILLLFYACWQKRYGQLAWMSVRWVVCIVIILSHYVITIPSGILIQYHSLHHVFVAVIFIFITSSVGCRTQGVYIVLIFLIVGIPMWKYSYADVKWFGAVTSSMVKELRLSLPAMSKGYESIVVDSRKYTSYYANMLRLIGSNNSDFTYPLKEPYQWRPAALELGFNLVVMCPNRLHESLSNFCVNMLSEQNDSLCGENSAPICLMGAKNNSLVFRFSDSKY